jgi:hypothetical protein
VSDNQNWDDPHRHRQDAHYRLYRADGYGPTVICVQDFDYYDYDVSRFLSPEAWDKEEEAEAALIRFRGRYAFDAVVVGDLRPGQIVEVYVDHVTGRACVMKASR